MINCNDRASRSARTRSIQDFSLTCIPKENGHAFGAACRAAAAVGMTIRFAYPTLGDGIGLLTLLWGIAAFPLYSICAAHMNDHVEEGGFVEASSGLLLIFAAGAILGPLIVSPSMDSRTPYALFSWIAGSQLLLAVFTMYRMRVRETVPESERSDFVESLNKIQRVFHSDSSSTESRPQAKGREGDE